MEILGASNDGMAGIHKGNDLRPRIKAAKTLAPSAKIVRLPAPVETGLAPRTLATDRRQVALRSVREATAPRCSRSLWNMPPAPSLTGQVVMVV